MPDISLPGVKLNQLGTLIIEKDIGISLLITHESPSVKVNEV